MAFNPAEYPPNWKEIREQVRARSGNRCEGCCLFPDCRAENGKPHPETGSRVVLTVAHWPDSTKMNCEMTNLLHLCNRCHLGIDRAYHLGVQRRNRELRRRRQQPVLPELEEQG